MGTCDVFCMLTLANAPVLGVSVIPIHVHLCSEFALKLLRVAFWANQLFPNPILITLCFLGCVKSKIIESIRHLKGSH